MDKPQIFTAHNSTCLRLDRGAESLPTFRKRIIYEGDFVKRAGDKEQKFSVRRENLLHWYKNFQQFRQNGITVPMPIRHSENPEDNRGEWLELEVVDEVGEDGKPRAALYGICQFRDAESAKLAKTSNVSFYTPKAFTDGKGNAYEWPITHICLTDYPVVPALGRFEQIAASHQFTDQSTEYIAMSLASLAEKVGLSAADKEEAALEADIFMAFDALKKEVETLKATVEKYKAEFGELPDSAAPAGDAPPAVAASHVSPAMKNILRDNRTMKLDNLVTRGKITPAARDKLKNQFLSDKSLTLALSHTGASAPDGFDDTLAALELNQAIQLGEQSGRQAQRLPNPGNGNGSGGTATNNKLIDKAKERAAKNKR